MKRIEINENDKILIVAPHPDDEIIGCGGVLAKYGPMCEVLLLTDGAKGHRTWSESRTRRIRKEEFETVMKECQVKKYYIESIEDRRLNRKLDCYWNYDLSAYSKIFIPNFRERHPDHKAAATQMMLNQLIRHSNADFFQYEVWSPLINPSHLLDISDIMDRKMKLLAWYKSQLNELDYSGAVLGLNQYRGKLDGIDYAECFKKGLI